MKCETQSFFSIKRERHSSAPPLIDSPRLIRLHRELPIVSLSFRSQFRRLSIFSLVRLSFRATTAFSSRLSDLCPWFALGVFCNQCCCCRLKLRWCCWFSTVAMKNELRWRSWFCNDTAMQRWLLRCEDDELDHYGLIESLCVWICRLELKMNIGSEKESPRVCYRFVLEIFFFFLFIVVWWLMLIMNWIALKVMEIEVCEFKSERGWRFQKWRLKVMKAWWRWWRMKVRERWRYRDFFGWRFSGFCGSCR